MVRDIGFDAAFTFMYSPRAGTPAEKWADPVSRDAKKKRLQRLIEIQNAITLERALSHVGGRRVVLIEGFATNPGSQDRQLVAGRTREEEVVVIDGGSDDFGKMIEVELIAARMRSFKGRRLDVMEDE
jgi:tRNA-2-methylthio-N6-dimethylallyladenosine synthase